VIEARLLYPWDGIVGSAALPAVVVLALCVMVNVVKPSDVPKHLGEIVGVVILLIMLPAIIGSLWNSMTLGQHLGITSIFVAIIFLTSATRRKSTKARH
jgi:ABC-type Fe3+ transport system permease subunit